MVRLTQAAVVVVERNKALLVTAVQAALELSLSEYLTILAQYSLVA